MRILAGAILIMSISWGQAQDTVHLNNPRKAQYYYLVQAGTLIGSYTPNDCWDCNTIQALTLSAATIHGVTLNRLRLGGGVGIDSYDGWVTVPVFASASWDLFKKQNALFVQLNYGAPVKTWKSTVYDEYGLKSITGAMMLNPSIGYRIHYHDVRLGLSVGYKMQVINSFYEYPTYYWDARLGQLTGSPSTTELRETLNRLAISLSIGWK